MKRAFANRCLSLLLPGMVLVCLFGGRAQAQADTAAVEVWFNEQYFITNANCEFAAIRRVTHMDASRKFFTGNFTDFDRSGHILLTGAYDTEGKKNGVFRTYYPGGYLRVESNYLHGEPQGTWYYYYNDGRPLAIVAAGDGFKINDFWDERNARVVVNGNGPYQFVEQAYGYNDKGYDARTYWGKLKDGRPDGTWQAAYVYGRTRSVYAVEHFSNGNLLMRTGLDAGDSALVSKMKFFPDAGFSNAEQVQVKPCRVDDQFNFCPFLRTRLNDAADAISSGLTESTAFTVTLDVNRLGAASRITPDRASPQAAARKIGQVFAAVGYWIPSQKDGRAINDALTVTLQLVKQPDGKFLFDMPVITRKNGS